MSIEQARLRIEAEIAKNAETVKEFSDDGVEDLSFLMLLVGKYAGLKRALAILKEES